MKRIYRIDEIIGVEIDENECSSCGCNDEEITPEGLCPECWMDQY